jgi:hypothetical protein
MLAETTHSIADTGNEVLLYVGVAPRSSMLTSARQRRRRFGGCAGVNKAHE